MGQMGRGSQNVTHSQVGAVYDERLLVKASRLQAAGHRRHGDAIVVMATRRRRVEIVELSTTDVNTLLVSTGVAQSRKRLLMSPLQRSLVVVVVSGQGDCHVSK